MFKCLPSLSVLLPAPSIFSKSAQGELLLQTNFFAVDVGLRLVRPADIPSQGNNLDLSSVRSATNSTQLLVNRLVCQGLPKKFLLSAGGAHPAPPDRSRRGIVLKSSPAVLTLYSKRTKGFSVSIQVKARVGSVFKQDVFFERAGMAPPRLSIQGERAEKSERSQSYFPFGQVLSKAKDAVERAGRDERSCGRQTQSETIPKKDSREELVGAQGPGGRKRALILCFLLLFFSSSWANAAEYDKMMSRAYKLYQDKKYDEALKMYEEAAAANPDKPEVSFGLGAARFKTSDYGQAAASFQKASATQDTSLEAKANYNTGNTKYMAARQKESSDLSGAVDLMKEALGYYKRALDLNPQDKDVKFNYEFVSRDLKLLEEKLKQQPPQAQKQQGQDDKEQKDQTDQKDQQQQGSSQQDKKEGEEKTGQQGQEENKEQKEQRDQGEAQEKGEVKDSREMSREEARMLLDRYEQEEGAQVRINDTRQSESRDVLKDW